MTLLHRRPRSSRHLALALLITASAILSACRGPAGPASAGATGSASGTAAGTSSYDAETTDVARVLAGMRPLRGKAFAATVSLPEWQAWEAESRAGWDAAWTQQVQPLRRWAESALTGEASGCRTLLHPFGGTDFLAAYTLFPGCEGYVLVGNEPVGQLPALEGLTASQLAGYVRDVQHAFPGVFGTPAGRQAAVGATPGPRLAGAIPLLLVQLARLDARILSAARFDLSADGRPLESIPLAPSNARSAALNLTFEVPNGRPQSLVYFPAELDDAALKRRPGAWTFLRMQAPFVTVLAPRPPLPVGRCSLLAELIRDQSQTVLQAQPAWLPLSAHGWRISTPDAAPAIAPHRRFQPVIATRQAPPVASGDAR